ISLSGHRVHFLVVGRPELFDMAKALADSQAWLAQRVPAWAARYPKRSERYNARETEPRWQRQWDEKAIFASKNDDPRPKYYVLEMFPYPSGRIHIGHVRNYTLG